MTTNVRRRPPLQIRLTPMEELWLDSQCERLKLTRTALVHRLFERAGCPTPAREQDGRPVKARPPG